MRNMSRAALLLLVPGIFLLAAIVGCTRIDEVTPTPVPEPTPTATTIPQLPTRTPSVPPATATSIPAPIVMPTPTSVPIEVHYECEVGLHLEPGEACAYEDEDQNDFVFAVLDDGSTYLNGDIGPLTLSERISRPGAKVCACGLETEWDGTGRTITALPEPVQIVDTPGIEKPREPFHGDCVVSMRLLPGELCRYPETYCFFTVSRHGEGQFLGQRSFNEISVDGLGVGHLTIEFSASAEESRWVINDAPPHMTRLQYTPVPCVASPDVTKLHMAISSRDSATVRRLLAEGVDVNGRSMNGNTPLWTALVLAEDVELAQLLMDAGADLDARDWNGDPLAHVLADEDSLASIQLLIDAGADLNSRDRNGDTLLGTASVANNLELMRQLLELGADPNGRGWQGWPVLARLLLSGGDGDIESAKLLIQAGADVNVRFADGDPVAEIAMRSNASDELLEFLLTVGVDIQALDHQQNPTWWSALRGESTDKLRILLGAGADPNACNSRGDPALRRAIELANAAAISLLIDAGANPSALTANGDPLLAIALIRNQTEAISLLVEAGADVNAFDSKGATLLELAHLVASPETVQYLVDAGAEA